MKNAIKPERKLYQDLKKNTCSIIWNRIENLSLLGMPDVLGYNNSGKFFTVELKVARGNKVRFSPHQIAFHKSHPKNTFILVRALGHGPRLIGLIFKKLLKLDAYGLQLGAWSLHLLRTGLSSRR